MSTPKSMWLLVLMVVAYANYDLPGVALVFLAGCVEWK